MAADGSNFVPGLLARIWPAERRRTSARLRASRPANTSSAAIDAHEAELKLYREFTSRLAQLCEQAAHGDLEMRLLHCPEQPDLARVFLSINHLLDMNDGFLREVGAALAHAAQKRFYRKVLVRGMRGSFRRAAQQINDASQQLANDHAELLRVDASRGTMSETVQRVVAGLTGTAGRMKNTAETLTQMVGGNDARQGQTNPSVAAKNSTRDLQHAVKALNEASRRIGGVVHLISDIAEGTNILALNATIEAARAGEAGRGFAVVASEVKKLAKQTTRATADINLEIEAVRSTAALTSQLLESLTQSIRELKDSSSTLEQQSEELAAAMAQFAGVNHQ
jgi:methyl-accepting chemotaxis protein